MKERVDWVTSEGHGNGTVELIQALIATDLNHLEDRLHQPYRARLVPGLEEIVKLRAPGLLGCALSGAGPSVLVFYERGYEPVCFGPAYVADTSRA